MICPVLKKRDINRIFIQTLRVLCEYRLVVTDWAQAQISQGYEFESNYLFKN